MVETIFRNYICGKKFAMLKGIYDIFAVDVTKTNKFVIRQE